MALDPIIVNIDPPKSPLLSKIPKLPKFTPKQTKILTAIAAVVIVSSMVLIAVATTLTNNSKFKGTHNIQTAADIQNKAAVEGTVKNKNSLPGAGEVLGVGGTSGENSPVVTLKADHGSVQVGGTVKLTWSVTNNPKSCVASEDWSGPRASSGSETTPALTQVHTYLFTLTCKTDKGTGFSTVSIGSIQAGTSTVAGGPTVNLAAQPSSVFVGQSATLNWTSTGNASSCSASGDWSGTKAASGQASTGALGTAGTKTYILTCSNSSGSSNPARVTVDVITPPPGAMVMNFDISPVGPVTPGTTATLSWNVTNARSCVASGDWSSAIGTSGSKSTGTLNLSGVPIGTYDKTYSYTITCTDADGTTSFSTQTIDVVPAPPVVSTFSFSPSTVSVNANSTLNWSSSSVDDASYTCSGTGGWAGTQATGSNKTAIISRATAGSYPFSLTCSNHGGSTTKSATLNVVALPTASVTAGATAVAPNGSTTINWSSNNASSCTGSNGLAGLNTTSGSKPSGALTTATTYTITCQNSAGSSVTASTTVSINSGGATVAPVVQTLTSSAATIGVGGTTNLTWSVINNPATCTASSTGSVWTGPQSATGNNVTVGPFNTAGTITLTLSCTNAIGTGSKSVTISVVAVPVVTIFTLTPATIGFGGSTTVNWSATNNPISCTASGDWSGSKAVPSGSQPDGSTLAVGTHIYQISCTNAGGQGPTASATLTVTAGKVYCATANNGSPGTPCYGHNQLILHNTVTDCWGHNLGGGYNLVINLISTTGTFLNTTHKGNGNFTKANPIASLCGDIDLQPFLTGKNLPGVGSNNHKNGAAANDATMRANKAGYYEPDPTMP